MNKAQPMLDFFDKPKAPLTGAFFGAEGYPLAVDVHNLFV